MSEDDYAEDSLRLKDDTPPESVHSFVERRSLNPVAVNGLTIWNFSTHEVDREVINGRPSETFDRSEYLIPYQVTPVWGYMQHVIPERIKSAGVLIYIDEEGGFYRDYENYMMKSSANQRNSVKERIQTALQS